MKQTWLLLFLLLPAAIYAQRFSALDGMEDQNGNTHLFYRIYNNIGIVNDSITNNVYHWNLAANTDTLYFIDYYFSNPNTIPPYSFDITQGFKFFNNNPDQYIRWGKASGLDYIGYIKKYNNTTGFNQPSTDILSIDFKNNDTLYAGTDSKLARSTNGGDAFNYLPNASGDFRALKYDPSGKFFGLNSTNRLVVSTDEGVSFNMVDTVSGYTIGSACDQIFLDKNPLYKYRLINSPSGSVLRASNNRGEAYSWGEKYSSTKKIFAALDNTAEGNIYLADWKSIYKSNNYGENWSLFKNFKSRIKGIYKKPGIDKIYAATSLNIYEITPDTVKLIKNLSVPPDILEFNPLDIGLKLIYNYSTYSGYPYWEEQKYDYSVEVIKDTLLDNGKYYRQLKRTENVGNHYVYYEYQRIDSANCLVYRYQQGLEGGEYLVEDLLSEIGDTIQNRRMASLGGQLSVLTGEYTASIFGEKRAIREYNVGMSIDMMSYRLVKGIGVDSVVFGFDRADGSGLIYVKGMVKNGIVYGDTTMFTGVNDNKTVVNNYELKQNYPNPFNPSTTIEFSLAKGDRVEVTVYDILGNRVKTLFDGFKPAGSHTVKFDARNLTSGVYIYKIKSGAFIASKKMILVK